jgi:hypothetical protein
MAPSLKGFVFTLKNPHNLPPQIFKLTHAEHAIDDESAWGLRSGDGPREMPISTSATPAEVPTAVTRFWRSLTPTIRELPRIRSWLAPGISLLRRSKFLR